MKAIIFSLLLASASAGLSAQSPAVVRTSAELGFSFTVPTGWDVIDTSAFAKEQARQNAQSADEKKGLGCVDVGFSARHGNPPSVMTEVALPFDCYGQQMTADDLPNFAAASSAGLAQNFDLGGRQTATSTAGTHRFFLERVAAAVKGQPDLHYIVEVACSVTKKAAVCWMTMAHDDDALAAFEHTQVSLDGDPPAPLFSADAFTDKP